jgi:aarF domain-containing kinase
VFPDFKFVWLGEETERNLPVELDFLNEARNIEKVAKLLEKHKYVKVPKVFWDYCSERVITMEFCEGARVDDLENLKKKNINPNRVKINYKFLNHFWRFL